MREERRTRAELWRACLSVPSHQMRANYHRDTTRETRFQGAIFNWTGCPNKTNVLESLTTMRQAANFVNQGQRDNAFEHLILLLRDVSGGEDQAHALVFGGEALESAGTTEEERNMAAHNKARDLLQSSFQSIRVCMPLPHADINGKWGDALLLRSGWVPRRCQQPSTYVGHWRLPQVLLLWFTNGLSLRWCTACTLATLCSRQ